MKKVVLLLISTILFNLKVFSQTGTNDDNIKIPKATAVKIAKDLTLLDFLKGENALLKADTLLYKRQLSLKDSLDSLKSKQITLYQQVVSSYDTSISIYKTQVSDLNKQNKYLKTKNSLLTIVGFGLLTFILIGK